MIEITFDSSKYEASVFGLTQWDKGQKLKINWADMPENIQVHFSSRGSDTAFVVVPEISQGTAVADIPDELLRQSSDIILWLYHTDGTSGESVRKAVLYVRERARPLSISESLGEDSAELLETILEDINENVNYIKENGTDSEYIPDYVRQEAQSVINRALAYQNENTVTILAASDAHLATGDYYSEASVKHMSQAMKLIAQSIPVDLALYLGDMTQGGKEKDISEAKSEIIGVNSALFPGFNHLPCVRCCGDEDILNKALYRNGSYISPAQLYNMIFAWNSYDGSADKKLRGYGYIDLEDHKLRVICLNTNDIYGKELSVSSDTAVMSIPQLNWLCSSLDLSQKQDSESWSIILVSHHPATMTEKIPLLSTVLQAYVSGSVLSLTTDSGESLSYDFTGKNSAVILAQLHGHLHNYKVSSVTDASIPVISLPGAGYYNSNFYSGSEFTQEQRSKYSENVTYDKTPSTAQDTAFCLMVVDKSAGRIYALHYGAGYDRIIYTDTVEIPDSEQSGSDNASGEDTAVTAYTNLVPVSVDSSGNTYNTTGYYDNYKLTSTGEVSYASGFTHTGYMPALVGDTVRIAGADFSDTAGNYILVYDSAHNLIWVTSVSGTADDTSGIAFTDTGTAVFTPSQVQTGTLSEMAYFRVSAMGQGSSLIVTVNEDIDGSDISEDLGSGTTGVLNILQYATDENGSLYGTSGYIDAQRLTSSGSTEAAADYTHTGFIASDSAAVVRFKGITLDGSEGCLVNLYDDTMALVASAVLSAVSNEEAGTSYFAGVTAFTPADICEDITSECYFRISGIGKGSNLIISYNEEI